MSLSLKPLRSPKIALDMAILCGLAMLAVLCYGKILGSGFFSDDYTFIRYLFLIEQGNLDLVYKCMSGIFLQEPICGLHYRPLLIFPWLADYFLWRVNPWGYHVTNLLIHIVNAILTYFAAKSLGRIFEIGYPKIFAVCSALIFLVSPLHSEAIFWISGRVDSLCALPYILSLWLYVCYRELVGSELEAKPKSLKLLYAGSLFSFLLALCIKEMALSLPFVLAIFELCLLFPKQFSARPILQGLKQSLPFFTILGLFLCLRACALSGEFIGGYAAPTANSSVPVILDRLFGADTLKTLAYPLNRSLPANWQSAQPSALVSILTALYIVSTLYLMGKYFLSSDDGHYARRASGNLIGFSILALLACAGPVYYLAFALPYPSGSRLLYMPMIFGSFLLAALFCPLPKTNNIQNFFGLCLLAILLMAYGFINQKNMKIWMEAAKYRDEFQKSLVSQLQQNKPFQKTLVVYSPALVKSVHLHHSQVTAQCSVSKPFTCDDLGSLLGGLTPTFHASSLIEPPNKLLSCLTFENKYRVYYPDLNGRLIQIESRTLKTGADEKLPITLKYVGKSTQANRESFAFALPYQMPTESLSLVKIEFDKEPKETSSLNKISATVYWQPSEKRKFSLDCSRHVFLPAKRVVYLSLNESGNWYKSKSIDALTLQIDRKYNVAVKSMTLVEDSRLSPRFIADPNMMQKCNGMIYMPKNTEADLKFSFDCTNLLESKGILVEISNPMQELSADYMSYRAPAPCPNQMGRKIIGGQSGSFSLERSLFRQPTYYCLRIFALNGSDDIIGLSSDPIFLQVSNQSVVWFK